MVVNRVRLGPNLIVRINVSYIFTLSFLQLFRKEYLIIFILHGYLG